MVEEIGISYLLKTFRKLVYFTVNETRVILKWITEDKFVTITIKLFLCLMLVSAINFVHFTLSCKED